MAHKINKRWMILGTGLILPVPLFQVIACSQNSDERIQTYPVFAIDASGQRIGISSLSAIINTIISQTNLRISHDFLGIAPNSLNTQSEITSVLSYLKGLKLNQIVAIGDDKGDSYFFDFSSINKYVEEMIDILNLGASELNEENLFDSFLSYGEIPESIALASEQTGYNYLRQSLNSWLRIAPKNLDFKNNLALFDRHPFLNFLKGIHTMLWNFLQSDFYKNNSFRLAQSFELYRGDALSSNFERGLFQKGQRFDLQYFRNEFTYVSPRGNSLNIVEASNFEAYFISSMFNLELAYEIMQISKNVTSLTKDEVIKRYPELENLPDQFEVFGFYENEPTTYQDKSFDYETILEDGTIPAIKFVSYNNQIDDTFAYDVTSKKWKSTKNNGDYIRFEFINQNQYGLPKLKIWYSANNGLEHAIQHSTFDLIIQQKTYHYYEKKVAGYWSILDSLDYLKAPRPANWDFATSYREIDFSSIDSSTLFVVNIAPNSHIYIYKNK